MTHYPIARTVGELVAELQKFDQRAAVQVAQPPFGGVQIIKQDGSGNVMVTSMPRRDLVGGVATSGARAEALN